MIEKKHFLALLAAGSLPVIALAQTTVPTQVATDGQDFKDIHWLAVPASVTSAMYGAAQSIAAPVTLSTGTATLSGQILGDASGVTGTPNGHLGPLPVPTWQSGGNSVVFGTAANYAGLGPVAIGVAADPGTLKYVGSSKVTLSGLNLVGPDSRRWSFKMVAADAESTDQPEELFAGTTDGAPWNLLATLMYPGGATDPIGTALPSQSFSYKGSTKRLANAPVLTTQDPASISITLKAGTDAGSTTGSAQAMAIGVWTLVPEVTVNCPTVTPAAASQACTVSVVNPPRDAFTIKLDPQPGIDSASSCLADMNFPVGTTSQSCVMQMPPGATGQVNAPAQPTASALAGWKITPSAVALNVPPNTPPAAVNDSSSTLKDTPVTLPASQLLGNDSDPDGDTLTITSVQTPVNGTVTLNGTDVVFTPAPGYTGPASFTYTISDGKGGTATATVNITVTAPPPSPPVAVDDSATTPKDTPVTLPATQLLSNDTDVNGDPLTITSVQGAVNGTATLVGTNVVFTPTPGYTGPASFTYTISDGQGGTATATVNIMVGSTAAAAVPVGSTGLLALMTALLAGLAGWSLRNRRMR